MVPAMSYAEMLAEYGTVSVGLLQIDTEGYDVAIVEQLDLAEEVAPSIIRFEHNLSKRIGIQWSEMQKILAKLHQHGYEVAFEENDVLAYRPTDIFSF